MPLRFAPEYGFQYLGISGSGSGCYVFSYGVRSGGGESFDDEFRSAEEGDSIDSRSREAALTLLELLAYAS